MISKVDKNQIRVKRHQRIRNRIHGTSARPRLNVFRSLNHIYAQVIDDDNGVTLAAASTVEKALTDKLNDKNKKAAAKMVGELAAQRAIQKGITEGRVRPRRIPLYRPGGGACAGRQRRRPEVLRGGRKVQRNIEENKEFKEKLVAVNRVAKVVKGGRNFRFTALVVVGDEKGRVGAGTGKAAEIPDAIKKAVQKAKKSLINVPMVGTTIPHEILGVFGRGKVLLLPASEGTGVIAGGPARAVLEMAGVKDIKTKSYGSNTPANCVKATIEGLRGLKTAEMVAKLRGISPDQLV